MFLTYRQVACLWERYWDRKVWEFKQAARLNPFFSEKPESGQHRPKEKDGNQYKSADKVDLTGDDAMDIAAQYGIKIKHRPRTQ